MTSQSPSSCTCPLAGYCEKHRVNKTEHWHHLCQTRQDYRQAWDDGRGPGQERDPSKRIAIEERRARQLDYMRALWVEAHSKQDPTPEWFADWVSRVPSFGCGCKSWLKEYLKTNPVRYDDLYAWSVECHDAVNKKRGVALWNGLKT